MDAPVDLKEGARVVYPSQGICEVEGIETLEVAGQTAEFLSLRRISDRAVVQVPVARAASSGIRAIASRAEAEAALFALRDATDEPDMNWKTRQRRHQQMLASGDLAGLAQMLRELYLVSRVRPLPPREREGYDQIRRLLVEEIGHVLDMPPVAVEDQIDLALCPPRGATREGRGGGEDTLLAAVARVARKAAKKTAKKAAKKTAKKAAKKTAKKAAKKTAKKAAKKTARKAAKKTARKAAKKTARKAAKKTARKAAKKTARKAAKKTARKAAKKTAKKAAKKTARKAAKKTTKKTGGRRA